jgi:hypothetical protein
MLLCKKIRVEINNPDILALEFMQGKCRGLYNWWVRKLRQQDMPLHQRTYKCPICSLVMDRDENYARNILLRFIARLEPHKLLSVCGVLESNQVIDTFTHV